MHQQLPPPHLHLLLHALVRQPLHGRQPTFALCVQGPGPRSSSTCGACGWDKMLPSRRWRPLRRKSVACLGCTECISLRPTQVHNLAPICAWAATITSVQVKLVVWSVGMCTHRSFSNLTHYAVAKAPPWFQQLNAIMQRPQRSWPQAQLTLCSGRHPPSFHARKGPDLRYGTLKPIARIESTRHTSTKCSRADASSRSLSMQASSPMSLKAPPWIPPFRGLNSSAPDCLI